MKKYLQVIKNSWAEYFVYRLNFIMWRVRTVLQLLTIYFLWASLFLGRESGELFGYTQKIILTYILGAAFLRAIVFSTRTLDIGEQIQRGELSNFLIRPINYFFYKAAQDVSDKAINIFFAVFEIGLIFLILKPPVFIQTDPFFLLFFALSASIAIVLYFLISFILGLIGFWSPEVWGPRFIFFIITEFLAGGLFPLDILPKWLFALLSALPFPYLLYFPLKIYLAKLTTFQMAIGILVGLAWVLILYYMVVFFWRKGLSLYEAVGR